MCSLYSSTDSWTNSYWASQPRRQVWSALRELIPFLRPQGRGPKVLERPPKQLFLSKASLPAKSWAGGGGIPTVITVAILPGLKWVKQSLKCVECGVREMWTASLCSLWVTIDVKISQMWDICQCKIFIFGDGIFFISFVCALYSIISFIN